MKDTERSTWWIKEEEEGTYAPKIKNWISHQDYFHGTTEEQDDNNKGAHSPMS
jgi:hypothetical protein